MIPPRVIPAVEASSKNNQIAASGTRHRRQRNGADAENLHLHSPAQPLDIEGPSDIGKNSLYLQWKSQ